MANSHTISNQLLARFGPLAHTERREEISCRALTLDQAQAQDRDRPPTATTKTSNP